MKTVDFINKYTEGVDQLEYNNEAGAVKNNLHTIIRASTQLEQEIGDNDNMPEWCQEKIAQVKGMIVDVMNYVTSQQELGKEDQIPTFSTESIDLFNQLLESDEFAPSKRAATSIATHKWRRGGERTGSYQGSVTTTFDHIKSVLGDPISGPTNDPYDKVSCEWILTFKDGVVASIYDYKTGSTPMGEYAWHIGGNNKKAVDYVTHLLGIESDANLNEDATGGATCSSVVGTVVGELGEEGMNKRQLNKKLGNYTNITSKGKQVRVKGAY